MAGAKDAGGKVRIGVAELLLAHVQRHLPRLQILDVGDEWLTHGRSALDGRSGSAIGCRCLTVGCRYESRQPGHGCGRTNRGGTQRSPNEKDPATQLGHCSRPHSHTVASPLIEAGRHHCCMGFGTNSGSGWKTLHICRAADGQAACRPSGGRSPLGVKEPLRPGVGTHPSADGAFDAAWMTLR